MTDFLKSSRTGFEDGDKWKAKNTTGKAQIRGGKVFAIGEIIEVDSAKEASELMHAGCEVYDADEFASLEALKKEELEIKADLEKSEGESAK